MTFVSPRVLVAAAFPAVGAVLCFFNGLVGSGVTCLVVTGLVAFAARGVR